jgi:uncharacterized protein
VSAAHTELLSKETESDIMSYARRQHARRDLAHSWEHTACVVRLAKVLSAREGARLRVTVPAAYLHDVRPRSRGRYHLHALDSALVAGRFLRRLRAFCEDEIEHIMHCIVASSYECFLQGVTPQTIESRVLRDADWLEAMGARGIARAFAFAEAHGCASFGHPVGDPSGPLSCREQRLDGPDATPIEHFYTKLLKLNALLLTRTGRRLGRARHHSMVRFLHDYMRETAE